MNMFKSNGGFTLVELIVVIAILAILAGVAVPAYSGYISRANDAAVMPVLDAISTSAMAANATDSAVTQIVVSKDGKTITVTAASYAKNFEADFATFFGCTNTDAETVGKIVSATEMVKFTNSKYAEKGATWTAANGWDVTK